MKRAPFLFFFFLVSIAACGGSTATTTSSSTSTSPQRSKRPVIAALKTHDGKVSIIGGGDDLRVHVTKDDGTVVADGATLDELRVRDPETWMLVKSSVAQGDGTYLDATFTETPAPTIK